MTPDGAVVWQYDADASALFRAIRYAPDYPGLARLQLTAPSDGKGLTPQQPREILWIHVRDVGSGKSRPHR